MSTPESRICGIDLGTTNSCIAVFEDGRPRVLELEGRATMPSVVAWKEGQWLVGQPALNHSMLAPRDAAISIKRKMDDPGYRLTLGGESLSPINISAKILAELVQGAQRQLGCRVDRAVITVPAWFQEQQRQATLEAGRRAGLEVLQIVNEPTAAAIAHERIELQDGAQERWLVYDLGGGTFDTSLLNVDSAGYQVLASEGNTFLGGDDFDRRLEDHFATWLRDKHNVDPAADALAMARLRVLAENTKVRLSDVTEVQLQEPLVVSGHNVMLDLDVTRAQFEGLIESLIDSTLEKVAQVLAQANVDEGDVQRLLLVGGSTRIPLVAEKLKQRFGMDAESWLDADLSVAMGACLRAAISCGQLFDRSVVDICPHSLGIAAMGSEDIDPDFPAAGPDRHPLTFVPLIRRNTRLPAQFARTFYKAYEEQRGAAIAVYQGEHGNTRHNNFIGEFYVEFSQTRSEQLDVQFHYDLNGTIRVSVQEGLGGTRREYTMDLSRSAEENSELGLLDESWSDGEDEEAETDASPATNFLIEKAAQKLQQEGEAAGEMADLLARYQTLLQQEGADDELDELEDRLYEWVDNA